jgi:hypothetical protein
MIDLRKYLPGDAGAAWLSLVDSGSWTQAEYDDAVVRLRELRLSELRDYAHKQAEQINPALGHPIAIELLKLLQPLLPEQLTPELQAAADLLVSYEWAHAAIEAAEPYELYDINITELWNG